MRLRILASALVLVPIAAFSSQGSAINPVFVESFDEIRVYLPQAKDPATLKDTVTVMVGGQRVPVRQVLGAEKATRANDPNFVTLPGSIQSALGGRQWDPAGEITRMVKVAEGVFEFVGKFPAGRYEYKVARGGSWAENYGAGFSNGGGNIQLVVPREQLVRFQVDFNKRTIRDSINNPGEIPTPTGLLPTPPATNDRENLYQSVRVQLARPLTTRELTQSGTLRIAGGPVRPLIAREVLNHQTFQYTGSDLGATWTPKQTTFKVWSPVASVANLRLFQTSNPSHAPYKVIPMRRGSKGVWYATVPGNLDGTYYQYQFESYGRKRVAADIYGVAASSDSSRSMVLDLRRTNPPGWPAPRLFQNNTHADAIIYEIHLRDFTVDPASGVRPDWRGKYLGLTQHGTKVPGTNFPTGIDYLKDLGITHVHILPFQDFNPGNSHVYNWGYETTLFNVPEEQYATDRLNSAGRIRETKQMIAAMQRANLGVVLDVVYNHSVPSEGEFSAFWETVPYYYFRTNDRGDVLNESGVGNALHDERPMVRKFIADSLKFWTKEYRLDGYRFDLIGMFARDSNIEFARAIRSVNPAAIIYGEPWTGGGPTRFGKGDQRHTGVAVFNDRFRGAFRGELDGPGPGFSMGGNTDRGFMQRILAGSLDEFTASPLETVNYVSAHDNLTFWDKVALSMPNRSKADHERAVKLAHAAVLLSQGMPFLEGGVQLGRTKGGNNNSYNAGDAVNQYDWKRAVQYRHLHEYFKGMIEIRKAHPAFRLESAEQVRSVMSFLGGLPENVVAYSLKGKPVGDPASEIIVILNGSQNAHLMPLPEGTWTVLLDGQKASVKGLRRAGASVDVPPLSAMVLRR